MYNYVVKYKTPYNVEYNLRHGSRILISYFYLYGSDFDFVFLLVFGIQPVLVSITFYEFALESYFILFF